MIRVCCTRCHATWGTPSYRRWPCPCGCGELVVLGNWHPAPRCLTVEQLWERNLIDWTASMRVVYANAGPAYHRELAL